MGVAQRNKDNMKNNKYIFLRECVTHVEKANLYCWSVIDNSINRDISLYNKSSINCDLVNDAINCNKIITNLH